MTLTNMNGPVGKQTMLAVSHLLIAPRSRRGENIEMFDITVAH